MRGSKVQEHEYIRAVKHAGYTQYTSTAVEDGGGGWSVKPAITVRVPARLAMRKTASSDEKESSRTGGDGECTNSECEIGGEGKGGAKLRFSLDLLM